MLFVSNDNCKLGYRFIKVIGLPSDSSLHNVLIYAVYGFVFVCYYASEIKFEPNDDPTSTINSFYSGGQFRISWPLVKFMHVSFIWF